ARHRPDSELQRAGHGDLVETRSGETYLVYLCGRPLRNRGRCTPGRETAIQPMIWSDDGWLRTEDGEGLPRSEVRAPALPPHPFPAPPTCDCTAAKPWAACFVRHWSLGGSRRTASAPPRWLTSSRSTSSRWPA